MAELSKKDEDRMVRYRGQSLRLLQDAMEEIRVGRWDRCEELLWGSLTPVYYTHLTLPTPPYV